MKKLLALVLSICIFVSSTILASATCERVTSAAATSLIELVYANPDLVNDLKSVKAWINSTSREDDQIQIRTFKLAMNEIIETHKQIIDILISQFNEGTAGYNEFCDIILVLVHLKNMYQMAGWSIESMMFKYNFKHLLSISSSLELRALFDGCF